MTSARAGPDAVRPSAEGPPRLGVSLRPQYTDWPALRDAALLVDELDFDWLLTSDHLMASGDRDPDPDGSIYEAWQLVAAWAALTHRVCVGVMVSGVVLRHPALLAKMAITLDHVSGGRAICGIGAGWFGGEAAAFGIAWPSRGERLDRLEEEGAIVRSLFDRPRTTFAGRHYRLTDAPAAPKPIQRHLPLLIGGGGEERTLRIAARYADIWNGFGSPETIARKIDLLHGFCGEIGRDPSTVTPTVSVMLEPAEESGDIVTLLRAYRDVGVGGVIIDLPAPYDLTLLRRVADVRRRLNR